MPAEASFSATSKGPSGELFTIRGDDYETFSKNVEDALGVELTEAFLSNFTRAFDGSTPNVAVRNAERGGFTPVPVPTPGGGGQQQAESSPPNAEYPGDCAHGRREYVDKPAKGRPWRRWECHVPWSPGVTGRCKPVNA